MDIIIEDKDSSFLWASWQIVLTFGTGQIGILFIYDFLNSAKLRFPILKMARIQAFLLLLQLSFIVGMVLTVPKEFETDNLEDEDNEIRFKRDVLKGKNGHDLIRAKRYIGRIPVAYMKKFHLQPYEEMEEQQMGNTPQRSAASHFREMLGNYHHPQQRVHGAPDPSTLTDEEIQSLLLMLDGYDLSRRPENLDKRVSGMDVGKRETGKKRSPSLMNYNYEQPMSFDNSDRLEFIGDGHNSIKRAGARNHLIKSSTRVKKETDLSVAEKLDRIFSEDDPKNRIITEKDKKSIDWSNYLGIDKRTLATQSSNNNNKAAAPAEVVVAPTTTNPIKPILSTKLANAPVSLTSTKMAKDTSSTKKDLTRKENETVDKNAKPGDDRKWVLDEFYKNFAMMTNVKRKRESPSLPSTNDLERLEQLEQQMTQVGDKIIWDALKYTGAHRDQDMTQDELAKVKASIVNKLATAYSLEKVRDAVDELRKQIAVLESNPPQI